MKAPAWVVGPVLLLAVVALSPPTLPTYDAYFPSDYRAAYTYFADRPGASIYALGPQPFFLLGRHGQHRVVYDLNPPRRWTEDPAGFVREILRCTTAAFLVLPTSPGEPLVRARRREGNPENPQPGAGCGTRYAMHP